MLALSSNGLRCPLHSCTMLWIGSAIKLWAQYLPWQRKYNNYEGGFPKERLIHCTPHVLTLQISLMWEIGLHNLWEWWGNKTMGIHISCSYEVGSLFGKIRFVDLKYKEMKSAIAHFTAEKEKWNHFIVYTEKMESIYSRPSI